MQLIDNRESVSVFDLGRNFVELSFAIIFTYSITLVALGLFCLFLSEFHRRNTGSSTAIQPARRRQTKERTFESKANRFLTFLLKNNLTSFQLLSLFMAMFFWQSLLFLTNSIKTNKVVLGEWPKCLSFWNVITTVFLRRHLVSSEERRRSAEHEEDVLLVEAGCWTESRDESAPD